MSKPAKWVVHWADKSHECDTRGEARALARDLRAKGYAVRIEPKGY